MFVCMVFYAAFNNLSVISRRNREDDSGYSHMLQNTSHGSKTTLFQLDLDIIKANILIKFDENQVKTVTSRMFTRFSFNLTL